MTWEDFTHARQLIAEERVGRASREAQDTEDEQMQASRRALGG